MDSSSDGNRLERSAGAPAALKGFAAVGVAALVMMLYSVFLRPGSFGPAGTAHPLAGLPLIGLSLTPLSGEAPPISKNDLAGKIVLMNFWGTWCPPCRRELPQIVAIQEEFADQAGFLLLSVSCGMDDHEPIEFLRGTTEEFLSANHYNFPTYADPGGQTRALVLLARSGNRFSYPTTLLLDQQGIIRAAWEGYRPGMKTEIGEQIAALLAAADSNVVPMKRAVAMP